MNTIPKIPAAVLALVSLSLVTHAQEFRDLERLRDADRPAEENHPEARRDEIHDRVQRGGMMVPEEARPGERAPERGRMERLRRQMSLGELTQPDFQEAQALPQWRIGVAVEPIDPFVRMHLGLGENAGARVNHVEEGSPAAQAGIEVDDIIIAADGEKIAGLEPLRDSVEKAGKQGKPVALELLHRGERRTLVVSPLGPKPEEEKRDARPDQAQRPFVELMRRLDRQDKEIEALRKELRKLRKQVEDQKDDDDKEE
ncbi:PDZ domain-containing protein [Haloferula sp. BvORR071]|uniref:PDZ domain-containing protein n=1 Tax=Haloferula sp. BvORR071 TaxID=1396141 RepID=UPI00054ED30C|nr:PDZ domain-containing protein [Haloferula sp. BvORR071]